MILYFSGTGNSAYVAKKIGAQTGDETVNLFRRIRDRDDSDIHSDRPWVIVSPVYAWRLPRILQEWLSRTKLTGSREIYVVLTCGDSIGNAGTYASKLCEARGMEFRGCIPVVMPENYIALFSAPAKDEAMEMIRRADEAIEQASLLIRAGKTCTPSDITLTGRINSGIVNVLFYPLFVHAKKFYATEACISCGKCKELCPLENIRLDNGKPVWGKSCTHCMACICRCPEGAIEYGRHTSGKVRYVCPERG